jgi:hypothetical protein
MQIDSDELKLYVKSALTAIKSGVKDSGFILEDEMEFDIAVNTSLEGGGGLKIHVVELGGSQKTEQISKIKFKVRQNHDFEL